MEQRARTPPAGTLRGSTRKTVLQWVHWTFMNGPSGSQRQAGRPREGAGGRLSRQSYAPSAPGATAPTGSADPAAGSRRIEGSDGPRPLRRSAT
jgi:hypothetical protein